MENKYSNLELEQSILGSAIMNNAVLLRVCDFVEEKHFSFEEHKAVWRRFIEVARETIANELTLQDFFANNEAIKGVGGAKYLNVLVSKATGVIDIRDYGHTLVELWQKRELEILLKDSLIDLDNKNFSAVSAKIDNELRGLQSLETKTKTESTKEIIARIKEERKLPLGNKVIQTGFSKLDHAIAGGIRSKQLVIIGGRAGIGKTTLSQNILLTNGLNGNNCLFISLEMSKEEVVYKFTSNLTLINSSRLQDDKLNQTEFLKRDDAESCLENVNIFINDSPQLRISEIGRIIKTHLEKNPIDLIVVDYVQIIKGDDTKNKNEAIIIKENTTMLKAFAKQYDVAIVALAQINRNGAEAPKIQDLKGSGGIEEDADIVILIHRDIENSKFLDSGALIVAKNRKGYSCDIPIKFEGEFGKFTEDNNL